MTVTYKNTVIRQLLPTDIKNCVLWLDAADASTIIVSGGVANWNDKSPEENICSQGTPALRPAYTIGGLNGKNIITFQSSAPHSLIGSYIPINGAEACTIFIVAVPATNLAESIAFYHGEVSITIDGSNRRINLDTGVSQSGINFTNRNRLFNENIINGTPIIVQHINPDNTTVADHDRYINGVLSTQASIVTGSINIQSEVYVIGASTEGGANPYNGAIAEVLVYSRELIAQESLALNSYLSKKWAIALP